MSSASSSEVAGLLLGDDACSVVGAVSTSSSGALSIHSNFLFTPDPIFKVFLATISLCAIFFFKIVFPLGCTCAFEILPNACIPLWLVAADNTRFAVASTFLFLAAGGIATSFVALADALQNGKCQLRKSRSA